MNEGRFGQAPLVKSVLVWILLTASSFAEESKILGLCDLPIRAPLETKIRGTGGFGADGFVLVNHACPLSDRRKDETEPVAVLLEFPSLAAGAVAGGGAAAAYYRALDDRSRSLYQVLASGRLECVRGFQPRGTAGGTLLPGNGYGTSGRSVCRLQVKRVSIFQELR